MIHKHKLMLLMLLALAGTFLIFQLATAPRASGHNRLVSTTQGAQIYLPLISAVVPPEVPIDPSSTPQPPANQFMETFDGEPAEPTPWNSPGWDITVHSRDKRTWYLMDGMQADHGLDCAGPPNQHYRESYEDAVYQCRNHVMTSINAGAYGVIYLTPNQMVDFSEGEATITFDVSTRRTSTRDWWDIWITPYDDHLQLPLEDFRPDLQGEPKRGLHIKMGKRNDESNFRVNIIDNHTGTEIDGKWWSTYETFLEPSATRRDRFELRISRTHVKFGMPDYDFWWVDSEIPELNWTEGVVQIGHHSYTPWKQNQGGPNTWHWDNFSIVPATPFTIIPAEQRYVETSTEPVTFAFCCGESAAPAGAHLRFAAIGEDVEVSFDGGQQWESARSQTQELDVENHFRSYWTPIPAGTTIVHFRANAWYGGDWHVRDISIWAREE